MGDLKAQRKAMYGTGDLGQLHVFGGGFINFGYWRDIPAGAPLTVEQRIASQKALYDLVFDALGPGRGRTLEVGCGRGVGVRGRRGVWGIDAEPEQVRRAGNPGFVAGDAAAIPFADGVFDAVVSVEAAQHFEDFGAFARECARVTRPGAKVAITTFFTAADAGGALAELLPTFARGIEIAHPVEDVKAHLESAGLREVEAESIGAHVWPGLDRWLEQGPHRDEWDRNYRKAADRGLLDYYLVTARKPAGSGV